MQDSAPLRIALDTFFDNLGLREAHVVVVQLETCCCNNEVLVARRPFGRLVKPCYKLSNGRIAVDCSGTHKLSACSIESHMNVATMRFFVSVVTVLSKMAASIVIVVTLPSVARIRPNVVVTLPSVARIRPGFAFLLSWTDIIIDEPILWWTCLIFRVFCLAAVLTFGGAVCGASLCGVRTRYVAVC